MTSRAGAAGAAGAAGVVGAARTIGTLALLTAALPLDVALVAGAVARHHLRRRHTKVEEGASRRAPGGAPRPPCDETAGPSRTVLLTGGKMTKALVLARAFHAAGHRVVLVESERYRLTAHRFSRAVAAFHVVPDAREPGYAEALLDVVRREGVDVVVPVCAPASSAPDAAAKALLEPHCTVLHLDPERLATVDDKDLFADAARKAGLDVPETHRVESAGEALALMEGTAPGRFILKSIAYDPVHRNDLTRLPLADAAATAAHVRGLPVRPDNPWVLQEFVTGREYCTHGTVRDGELVVWVCCESSGWQLNYAAVERPDLEAWVRTFVAELGGSGQLSFDFLVTDEGRAVALECNPRTHSALSLVERHPGLAAAYLGEGPPVRAEADDTPTYWLHHELWRLLRRPATVRERLRVLRTGRDAVLAGDDPLPFLALHHLHVPSLLLGNLRSGRRWTKIDLNIGKLVEPGGD